MVQTCPYTISGQSLERKTFRKFPPVNSSRIFLFFHMGRHIKQHLYFTKYISLLGYEFDIRSITNQPL